MPIYVALLRGVNMGPHKRMSMEALRKSFIGIGFENVQTYIQSGNVVFKGPKSSSKRMCGKLEAKLAGDFGFEIPVLIRGCEEMKRIAAENPFLQQKGIDASKLHVTFLWQAPTGAAIKKLTDLAPATEHFHWRGTEVYLYLPSGYGTARLSNNTLAGILGGGATTRNWKTVNQLCEMASRCE